MQVCYFGAYDRNYPRNSIIRKGLSKAGVDVVECRVSPKLRTWKKYPKLLVQYLKEVKNNNIDVLIAAEFGQSLLPLVKLISFFSDKPLVFDPFTSLYDSTVCDRKTVQEGSIKAKYYYYLDKISFDLADIVLVDTMQHQDYFNRQFGVEKKKLRRIFVGVDDGLFYPRKVHQNEDSLLILFYGSYIPLHGVQHIIRAAKILESQKNIRFELIGNGQTYKADRELADKLGLENTTFKKSVVLEELPSAIARADICLGIFGGTDKAKRVIPNKVYQAMAMKKPVITGESPAIKEAFEDKHNVYLCEMANPESLAKRIKHMTESKTLRRKLALSGYELICEKFTPITIGREVKKAIEEIV